MRKEYAPGDQIEFFFNSMVLNFIKNLIPIFSEEPRLFSVHALIKKFTVILSQFFIDTKYKHIIR